MPRTQRVTFDPMGRPLVQTDSAAGVVHTVATFYDAGGLPDSVVETARPDSAARRVVSYFQHDAVGREVAQSGNGWIVHATAFDLGGNVRYSTRTPRDSLVYDALNRLRARMGGPDSATYAYDLPTGQLSRADNVFARIGRTYYPNGALKGDTIAIATDDTSGFTAPDGLAMSYDLNGRRSTLQYPAALARTLRLAYDTTASGTGLLAQLRDDASNTVHTFHYDRRGRLDSLVRRATSAVPIIERRQYDRESNAILRTVTGTDGHVYVADALQYDGLNRVINATSGDSLARYDGLGHVVYARGLASVPTEKSIYDALGNRTWNYQCCGHGTGTTYFTIDPLADRVLSSYAVTTNVSPDQQFPDTTTNTYEGNGSLAMSETRHAYGYRTDGLPKERYGSTDTGYVRTRRTNMYRGGQLASSTLLHDTMFVATTTVLHPAPPYTSVETYRYDALGRRVWREMVYPDNRCETLESVDWCVSTAVATVWDDQQLLMERRHLVVGYSTTMTPSTDQTGTIGYVHGLELDHPLVVLKAGQHDVVPLANWTGKLLTGACPDTACLGTDVQFPQARSSLLGARRGQDARGQWYGSLVEGLTDGSGYIYQRNRYLDSETGHFTQTDPIGLAGGLNLYGFAGGDPVSYSDPFGLCPPEDDNNSNCTAGSSEWYAGRIANGEGNRVLNELGGLGATCAESISCMTTLVPATVVGAAIGRVAQALGLAEKAVGNVSIAVGSELETQVAGKVWTGRGASAIRASHGAGDVVGAKSANGLKIFREAAVKPPGHFSAGESVANLVNKVTGGNTHLVITPFMWW